MLFQPRHTRSFDVLSSEALSGSIKLRNIIRILMWAVNVETEDRSVRASLTVYPGDFDPHLHQQTSNQKKPKCFSFRTQRWHEESIIYVKKVLGKQG